jgi:hypothetical protein
MTLQSDLDFLRLHIGSDVDGRGRLPAPPGMTIAMAANERSAWINGDLPDEMARDLLGIIERAPVPEPPPAAPGDLDRCEEILRRARGPVQRRARLFYLFADEADAATGAIRDDGTRIERSDRARNQGLRTMNPGNWQPVEWEELLEGQLGPWAMALQDRRVISICHTPRPMTDRTAECGVWTHPEFRGQGHAAAVTAVWASILRPSRRYLFYSTDPANRSSQRVAERLRLRHIGRVWQIQTAEARPAPDVHPMSRLRTR